MDSLIIRPAHTDDIDIIVHFNIEMALESENLKLSPEVVRQGVEMSLGDPERGRYFLAEQNGSGNAIGQIRVTREWSDWNNGHYWWIQNVYVDPALRKQGVYTALHTHIRKLAREANACGLLLYVDHENTSAQEVYCHLGMGNSHYLIYEQEKV